MYHNLRAIKEKGFRSLNQKVVRSPILCYHEIKALSIMAKRPETYLVCEVLHQWLGMPFKNLFYTVELIARKVIALINCHICKRTKLQDY
ncbi:hypothetical protein Hanom_Chr03g00232751 [Helianthus anomalus]